MKLNWKKIKWLIIAGSMPPIYFNIRALIEQGEKKLNIFSDYIFWFGISIGITVFLAIIIFQQINWLDKILPWKKNVAKRIIAEIFITMATVISAMAVMAYFTYPMHVRFCNNVSFNAHLFEEFTTGIILLMIILSVTEGSNFFNQWKDGLVLSEKLNKEKVESQLEALVNQANPHFLFNSLNVLSSLVHSDPDKAEEFINKFASVYRYVLNIQDRNVVTLNEELDFLKSYMYLQKIRFNEGLNFEIDIDEKLKEYFIVPFSLQMLVENAIKHNIVSKENPLTVNVYIDQFKVFVKNNIQLREDDISSNGVGLSNLRQRYFHLAGIMPDVNQAGNEFVVSIPLLKPEKKEESIKYDHDECCNHRRRKSRSRKA
ncbi:MAG: histidine kinase [Bacteroidales bacterium]|nr:histidine kinase [Bacteroidales bacterium]